MYFGLGESMWRAASKPRRGAKILANSNSSLRMRARSPEPLTASLDFSGGDPLAPTGSKFIRLGVGTGLSGGAVIRGYADAGNGRGPRVRHANGWWSDSTADSDSAAPAQGL